MFGKPPEPKRAIMSPENDTAFNWSNIHSQSCTKDVNKSQANQFDPHPKPDSVNGEKSKTYNLLNSKSDDHPPDNSMNKEKPLENPEKDPSTAIPKELSIYIFDQRIKLMKRINTINNKTMKLDSLIIKENYKPKEISKKLDLLKHKWKNSPKKVPIKKLIELVSLCHKFGYLTENITDMNELKKQMKAFCNNAQEIHKNLGNEKTNKSEIENKTIELRIRFNELESSMQAINSVI